MAMTMYNPAIPAKSFVNTGYDSGWRGGKEAARCTIDALSAVERTGVIYGGDGATAI